MIENWHVLLIHNVLKFNLWFQKDTGDEATLDPQNNRRENRCLGLPRSHSWSVSSEMETSVFFLTFASDFSVGFTSAP